MISVRSEARFRAFFKHFAPATAAAMVGLASLAFAAGPVAAADPPVSNGDGALQVALAPPPPLPEPSLLDRLFYNVPIYTRYPSPYNAPREGGGFYFGPSGSLSVLRDSDLIKRFEPRTSDTFLSIPRSITGDSTSWLRSSGTGGTSSWAGTSTPWLLSSEGGSKTKQLTSSLGYDVGARAGYQWGNFRGEFQFDYANNSVDTFGNPNRISDFVMRDRVVSGSTTGMSFLVNGFLDLNVPYLNGYGATPYFGGGIGGGQTSLDLKVGTARSSIRATGVWRISSAPACAGRLTRLCRWISATASGALATLRCTTSSRRSMSPIAATTSR
jgi:hypothetical protein